MSIEFDVDGSVDLGGGYRLVATGFRGSGTTTEPSDYAGGATRSATTSRVVTGVLGTALDEAGMREEQAIELSLIPEPGAEPSRSARQEDAVILEAPDLGEGRGQVVMLTDEDGGVSFHYPVESELDQTIQPPGTRGSGGTKVFVIPAEVPPGAPATEGTRSLVGAIGRKLLQVLSFPVATAAGRLAGRTLVRRWEERKRPYGLRWFGPDDYRTAEGDEVADFDRLDGRRSLLFVHGTFSTAHGGFGGLPRPVIEDLWDRYEGRVLAFNHHSLSSDPIDNVAWLMERIPPDVSFDLDVVAHSRGGLVARVLAGGRPDADLDLERLRVHSVVCAGTPNYGTPLADPRHLSSLCDRLATATNLVPGLPAAEVADAVLLMVQLVAQGVLDGLPGLEVMNPGSDFLQAVNGAPTGAASYFGVAANYEPTERGMKRVMAGLKDGAVDFVFSGAQNDLVVPTVGVHSGDLPFAIAAESLVEFDASRGVMHNTFWKEPEIAEAFSRWLR